MFPDHLPLICKRNQTHVSLHNLISYNIHYQAEPTSLIVGLLDPKMGSIGYPKKLVTNYQSKLRIIPEELRP
jgi:hypothetical protein